MNINHVVSPEDSISKTLSLIGQPTRIQILAILEPQEACVCHIEAATGIRQAIISQHLMVMRKAGLVNFRRDGRNIFYSLQKPEAMQLIWKAADLSGQSPAALKALASRPVQGCACPQCNPEMDPAFTCGHTKKSSSCKNKGEN